MKNNIKIMYFYAHWDDSHKTKKFYSKLCKQRGWKFDAIDCETSRGVALSTEKSVKLCPYVIVYMGDTEIARGISQEMLQNLFDL